MADGSAIINELKIDLSMLPAEVHRREDFEAGYMQAKLDVLSGLVFISEQFLQQRSSGSAHKELRKILYAFVDQLEQQIERASAIDIQS